MARGWIKLWRQVDDSAISHLSPLHFRVWCWILTNACQRPTTLSSSGEELQPGELATTYGRISSAVAWKENRADVVPSLQQIRTVIRNLEKLEMVQNCNRTSTGYPSELPQELQQGYLLLKVLHWDTYQGAEKVTATETVTGLQQGTPENFNNRIRSKEEKKEPNTLVRNVSANGSAPEGFTEWWSAYPRKNSKGHAVKAYAAALKKTTADVLLSTLQSQTATMVSKGPQWIPMPATWLNGERWADEVALTPIQEYMIAAGHTEELVRGK